MLLGLLLWLVEWRAVLDVLGRAQPGWLLLAAVLLVAQTALSALRWRLVAARLGQRIGMGLALREYFLAQAVNMALPGGVAGDAARAVRARAEVGLERAGMAVVLERAAGQVALVVVTAAAVLAVTLIPGGMAVPGAVVWGLLLVLGGVWLVLLVLSRMAGRRAAVARWRQGVRVALLAPGVRGGAGGVEPCDGRVEPDGLLGLRGGGGGVAAPWRSAGGAAACAVCDAGALDRGWLGPARRGSRHAVPVGGGQRGRGLCRKRGLRGGVHPDGAGRVDPASAALAGGVRVRP